MRTPLLFAASFFVAHQQRQKIANFGYLSTRLSNDMIVYNPTIKQPNTFTNISQGFS